MKRFWGDFWGIKPPYIVPITLIKIISQIIWIFSEEYWMCKWKHTTISLLYGIRILKWLNLLLSTCGTYHLHNLIRDPTCFKNLNKPLCTDLLLTNIPESLLKSQTLETGLSDFHKLMLTVLKIHYKKQKPLVATYRDYKNFSNVTFRTELLSAMQSFNNIYFADFRSEFLYLLGKHALVKKRYIKANH